MTETLPATRTVPGVTIRPYRPADHNACRRLWAELTQHRDELNGRAGRDSDGGAGFEEYLTQLNLSGMWVADQGGTVIGFVGLMLDGRTGEVDPVVVTQSLRGHGVGRNLLTKVADEARRRGLQRLTISPPVRDVAALHTLHSSGFATLATVTLSYDLGQRPTPGPRSTMDLYDLRFAI
jgi:GNAT superfamily N-acetyltransferase